jgi:RNA polymerase sigma factor (sigma-70 family)
MPLLRFRSDEQLVALFRAGHDEAFRAIHDRYHKRLFAYARQMLPGRQDAEDALQDVFVRAYFGLRASDHQLALRAWLFRVAHNRCIDELRRPAPPPPELLQLVRTTVHDPLAEVDLRESLRRLVEDIRRLPEQQRSALLMRELIGMSYSDLSASLGISIGAVKSLLVRARVALAQAAEARDTSCVRIREQLVEAHDRGLRPNANARKHMRDCTACKSFRHELRGMSRQLAAVTPAVGPLGLLAKLGFSSGAGGGAAGGGGLALLGGGGGAASAGGVAVGVNHIAAVLVAAVATAGGAVELQRTIIAAPHHPARAGALSRHRHRVSSPAADPAQPSGIQAIAGAVEATVSTAPALATATMPPVTPVKPIVHDTPSAGGAGLSPATGAGALINSNGDSTAGASGTATGASACSSTSGSGTTATTSGSPANSTAPPTAGTTGSSASTSSAASPSQSSAGTTTITPCAVPPSPGAGSASTTGNPPGSASSTSAGSGSGSSGTGTSGSASAGSGSSSSSSSSTSSSSPSTASSGGSSSVAQ